MDLIKKSDEMKDDADQVVSDTKIVETLEELGKVTFVGSYALNLLYRPDIDLFVQSDDCTLEKAIKVTKSLLDSRQFQTVGFSDWSVHEPPNGVAGFYWELVCFSQKYRWKLDVWFTAIQEVKTIGVTNRIRDKLIQVPAARLQILKLKDQYFDGVKYRDGFSGIKIYEEVLGKV